MQFSFESLWLINTYLTGGRKFNNHFRLFVNLQSRAYFSSRYYKYELLGTIHRVIVHLRTIWEPHRCSVSPTWKILYSISGSARRLLVEAYPLVTNIPVVLTSRYHTYPRQYIMHCTSVPAPAHPSRYDWHIILYVYGDTSMNMKS